MQIAMLVVATVLPVGLIADSSAITLDQPTNVEATAAYRAIPAVAQASGPTQELTAEIKSCKVAEGRPGVICRADVKKAPSVAPLSLTIYFARGPDSAWIATLEQTAP